MLQERCAVQRELAFGRSGNPLASFRAKHNQGGDWTPIARATSCTVLQLAFSSAGCGKRAPLTAKIGLRHPVLAVAGEARALSREHEPRLVAKLVFRRVAERR